MDTLHSQIRDEKVREIFDEIFKRWSDANALAEQSHYENEEYNRRANKIWDSYLYACTFFRRHEMKVQSEIDEYITKVLSDSTLSERDRLYRVVGYMSAQRNEPAINAFSAAKDKAYHKVKRLCDYFADHCELNPSDINWNHVGAVNQTNRQLDEIIAFLGIKE